jgi:hypothetical protein
VIVFRDCNCNLISLFVDEKLEYLDLTFLLDSLFVLIDIPSMLGGENNEDTVAEVTDPWADIGPALPLLLFLNISYVDCLTSISFSM